MIGGRLKLFQEKVITSIVPRVEVIRTELVDGKSHQVSPVTKQAILVVEESKR